MKEKEKAIVYLQGGFGNTLFQLVAYLTISNQIQSCYLVTDLTKKNLFTKILGWKIHDNMYPDLLNFMKIETKSLNLIQIFTHLILGKISKVSKRSLFGVYFFSDELNTTLFENVNFGYYQSKNFLHSNRLYVVELGKNIYHTYRNDKIKLKTGIAVHIRLGDSIWAKKHSGYYENVISILKQTNEPFTVITDSIADAKILFEKFENVEYQCNSAKHDFSLMLSANTLFMAPSTFSYWAGVALQSYEKIYMPRYLYDKLGFPHKHDKLLILD